MARWIVYPRAFTTLAVALALTTPSCAGERSSTSEEVAVELSDVITVSSTAFGAGKAIPVRFTCDGAGDAPPLTWEPVPVDAKSLALVVDDPDAPSGTFVHWVVVDLPPATRRLDAAAVPQGAVQAKNSAGRAAYFPPCPPSGTHHYRFTVYALSRPTGLHEGAGLDQALRAIASAATARGRLVGTYGRQ